MEKEIKNWEHLGEKLLHKTRVFSLYENQRRSPDGKITDDFYTIDSYDWVNVIPITTDNQVVMVEQFRHGIQEPTLEIPGGLLNGDESDPSAAAKRELTEETGYVANELIELGWVHPNPAIQSNKSFFYTAYNVELQQSQNLDFLEDIAVRLVPLSDIPKLLKEHKITHTVVVAALSRFFLEHYEA